MKRAFVLALVIACGACGGKVEEGSTDPTTASGGTPSPTATTTTSPPSPGSPGTPPPPTPIPPKDPTPASTKVITAVAQPGGLDHILIYAADAVADSCITVHLASPFGTPSANDPYVGVMTAPDWGVRGISRSPGAKRCGPGKQPPAAEESTGAKGTITFGPTGASSLYPCTVEVHVSALFSANPTLEQLDGSKIVVDGACP
jgi:hypothetical protein